MLLCKPKVFNYERKDSYPAGNDKIDSIHPQFLQRHELRSLRRNAQRNFPSHIHSRQKKCKWACYDWRIVPTLIVIDYEWICWGKACEDDHFVLSRELILQIKLKSIQSRHNVYLENLIKPIAKEGLYIERVLE